MIENPTTSVIKNWPVNFPAICIDNFYENVDLVREFALKQDFFAPETGHYPGKRTKPIYELDKKLFDYFCQKLFSIFYDLNTCSINWVVETSFQLVEPHDQNKKSIKNHGWIHIDDDCFFSGVIYLNPLISGDCGTSIYKLIDLDYKDESLKTNNSTYSSAKTDFYLNGVAENYEYHLEKNIKAHEETIRFNNQYNRMIAFEGGIPHGVRSFHTTNEPRLTQVFFVYKLESSSPTPLVRMRG